MPVMEEAKKDSGKVKCPIQYLGWAIYVCVNIYVHMWMHIFHIHTEDFIEDAFLPQFLYEIFSNTYTALQCF